MKYAILASALFLAGCGSTPQKPEDKPESASLGGIKAGDRLLEGQLEVVSVERTGDGRTSLGCSVEVAERVGSAARFSYRMHWYSAEGREVRSGEPAWQEVNLGSRGTATLLSTAPAPWCAKFTLELRKPG